MKIKYQILKEMNLLILKYSGHFTFDQFAQAMKRLVEKPEWKYVKNMLCDYSEVIMDVTPEELSAFTTIRTEVLRKNILGVILVDNPYPTAAVILYIKSLKNKYDYHYCSTFDHAISLLELNENKDEIEVVWKNLKNLL